MKIAILFDNFGPYHLARLQAAAKVSDLLAVEFAAKSGEYRWNAISTSEVRREVIQPEGRSRDLEVGEFRRRLHRVLSDFRPAAVLVPGWASKGALLTFDWCCRNRVPAVVMSESTPWDQPRVWWKEGIKRKVVGLASAALAGGQPHREYLVQLGLPVERIFLGYDAVDNAYFSSAAREARKHDGPMAPFFLASNRFIEKKNLSRLVEAYHVYASHNAGNAGVPWDLVLLGDGELRHRLIEQCRALRLPIREHAPWESPEIANRQYGSVFFPGFRQIEELPRFYAHAGTFIHASTTEQWGLVVNEAMASGLPVLVSNRCGCANDLVTNGLNGFSFDPLNVTQLAELMEKVSAPGFPLARCGEESLRIISQWGPARFTTGLVAAVEKAVSVGPVEKSLGQGLLLRLLAAQ